MRTIREWIFELVWREDERVLRLEMELAGLTESFHRVTNSREQTRQIFVKQQADNATIPGKLLKSKRLLLEKEYEMFILERRIKDTKAEQSRITLNEQIVWLAETYFWNWLYKGYQDEEKIEEAGVLKASTEGRDQENGARG